MEDTKRKTENRTMSRSQTPDWPQKGTRGHKNEELETRWLTRFVFLFRFIIVAFCAFSWPTCLCSVSLWLELFLISARKAALACAGFLG